MGQMRSRTDSEYDDCKPISRHLPVSVALSNRHMKRSRCQNDFGDLPPMNLRRSQAKSDQADFQAIYDRYSREVWAVVYARWLQTDAAVDIMQETFLRYWKHCQSRAEPIREP